MPRQSLEQREAKEWVYRFDLPLWFVYGLVNSDGEVSYVGKTKDGIKRLAIHRFNDQQRQEFDGAVEAVGFIDYGLRRHEACVREGERYDPFRPEYNGYRPRCDCGGSFERR